MNRNRIKLLEEVQAARADIKRLGAIEGNQEYGLKRPDRAERRPNPAADDVETMRLKAGR